MFSFIWYLIKQNKERHLNTTQGCSTYNILLEYFKSYDISKSQITQLKIYNIIMSIKIKKNKN